MKHVTVRLAWHDNKWNGRICTDPQGNYYCRDNYSLLSPRIQRRIDLQVEDSFKDHQISDTISKYNYSPPCYWSINLMGKKHYNIEDPHPFQDLQSYGQKFASQVPPLHTNLSPHSVVTWCFKLGYTERGGEQAYVPMKELKNRVDVYTDELHKGKSIAFFYANYSNPLTGDEYHYALLGAGLVDGVDKPPEYKIPESLLEELRKPKRRQNFPTTAWQFQINLNPNFTFIMPYHEYLDWKDQIQGMEKTERSKKFEKIVIPIVEQNVIPHFKYVSMHVNHDKAIFLLYLLKKSLGKIIEHGDVVSQVEVDSIKKKIDGLMKIAWQERGQYPGFENVICIILKNMFEQDQLKKIASSLKLFIMKKSGTLEKFFNTQIRLTSTDHVLSKGIREIERYKDVVEFLSRFDFSVNQFDNIREIISKNGLQTIKNNPYLLLETYYHDTSDNWNIDDSDYGIDLYQIDIALIPDLSYAGWEMPYSPDSPERLRAVVSKILYDAARDGSSCLTREDIIEGVKNYPLFYITEDLNLDMDKLIGYEKQPIFKQKFHIQDESFKGGPVLYQLKQLRTLENSIEQFLERMLAKKYSLDTKDESFIDGLVKKEKLQLGDKLDPIERKSLYRGALQNGLFILSGKAGSGKTSAIINLVKKFGMEDQTPIYVFTPTGKANLVVRDRLKAIRQHEDTLKKISTIHRFLYSAISEAIGNYRQTSRYNFHYQKDQQTTSSQISRRSKSLVDMISKILSGNFEILDLFMDACKGFKFSPKIVIIDEASMIDEVMLGVLFAMLNPDTLKHLIIVGDEKQLPPIGPGRPFVDTVFHLKRNEKEANYIRLESNFRFDPSASMGILADLFGGDKEPLPSEIKELLSKNDDTLEVSYFSNNDDLKDLTRNVLRKIGKIKDGRIIDMFGDVFEDSGAPHLDRLQIITPRRVGSFGSVSINTNIVKNGTLDFSPRTKLICEENKYVYVMKNGRFRKMLALANGSVGYIMPNGRVTFEDLEDLEKEFGRSYEIEKIRNEAKDDFIRIERDINFGYAITIHKAQGSDYENLILVIPEMSKFIMRELLYTAFTRTKTKLHIMVHSSLKKELSLILAKAYQNSSIGQRMTMMFGYKSSPHRAYILTIKNGKTIEVRSKIEQIIARSLDNADIEFEYEPEEFYQEFRLIPDFKFTMGNKVYYLEHLGNMMHREYKNRWIRKLGTYEKIGIIERLITTSESENPTDSEQSVFQILNDIISGTLKGTEGSYSKHHYFI